MNTVSCMNLEMLAEFRDYRNQVDLKEMNDSESSLSTEIIPDNSNHIHINPSLYGQSGKISILCSLLDKWNFEKRDNKLLIFSQTKVVLNVIEQILG